MGLFIEADDQTHYAFERYLVSAPCLSSALLSVLRRELQCMLPTVLCGSPCLGQSKEDKWLWAEPPDTMSQITLSSSVKLFLVLVTGRVC